MTYTLRPHQTVAVKKIRDAFRRGKRTPILQAPTGFGKTLVAIDIIKAALAKGKRVLFVVDRIKLIDQTSEAFDYHGLDHGIIQGDHWRVNNLPLQLASVQTLVKRRRKPDVDFIIVDECFVAGTKVSTPKGTVNIELVSNGDLVYTSAGVGVVEAVTTQRTSKLIKMGLSDGEHIECTEDHPIFTRSGWKKAKELEVGERLYREQDMYSLWGGVQSDNLYNGRRSSGDDVRKAVGIAEKLRSILCEEIKKPDAQQAYERENVSNAQADWSQAKNKGWQRHWRNSPSEIAQSIARIWLAIGVHTENENKNTHGRSSPSSLQDRCGEQVPNDSNRGRRGQSLHAGAKKKRQEERFTANGVRVESVESVECTGGRSVYNLQVAGHPSYFANGVLVHNCHSLNTSFTEIITRTWNALPFLGLSATPFTKGLGKIYDDLIVVETTQSLIDKGFLSDFIAYGAVKLNLDGIKTVAGDYNQSQVADRVSTKTIIGDVVDTWLRRGENRKTICFCVNIAHAEAVADEFNANGVPSAMICSHTVEEDRAAILEAYENGDIKILCNVEIFTKGWDSPSTSCLILARPTKSLMLYVQMAGRVLRTAKDKKNAIILDHGRNIERLGFPTDPLPEYLCNGEKSEREKQKEQEKREVLPKPCPNCNFMKTVFVCPSCGHKPEVDPNVKAEHVEMKRLERVSPTEKADWYAMLLGYARSKGKKDGYAAWLFKDKFGHFPHKNQGVHAKEPNQEVKGFITHTFIKKAKSRFK